MRFVADYAKSDRSTCKRCGDQIKKEELRLGRIIKADNFDGNINLWFHENCFFINSIPGDTTEIEGFITLKNEDQKRIEEKLDEGNSARANDSSNQEFLVPEKQIKIEEEGEKLSIMQEEQQKTFDSYRSQLYELETKELDTLLNANFELKKYPIAGRDDRLNQLADFMTFGLPAPCPECAGQLMLDDFTYKCVGDINAFAKCTYKTKTPERLAMKIPEELKNYDVLREYTGPRYSERIFKEKKMLVRLQKPLKNLEFFICGFENSSKDELKKLVQDMGGRVKDKIAKTLAAIISTRGAMEKMNQTMGNIKEMDIEVVDETFLSLVDPNGTVENTLELIKEEKISEWGSGPAERLGQEIINKEDDKKPALLGDPGFLINSSEVHPRSKLVGLAKIYIDANDTPYSAVLNKVDAAGDKNSYYLLQVLVAKDSEKFWLFRYWGRTGRQGVNNDKTEEYEKLDEAILVFEYLFYEKTGNLWKNRKAFEKKAKLYHYIDSEHKVVDETVTCPLPKALQDLMRMIFDINEMKKTLLEYKIDADRMPLGNLSKEKIYSAYEVLKQLYQYMKGNPPSTSAHNNIIEDCTNRFYTFIPHNVGTGRLPRLDNVQIIEDKFKMLASLEEMEISYSISRAESSIEARYRELKADITPLDKNCDEYKVIVDYVRHTGDDNGPPAEVQEIFHVVRHDDERKFEPYKNHDRKLLWHGSRVVCFAGIISQGLRISPPGVHISGKAFGNGIYFADMFKKSVKYCNGGPGEVVMLLLCEVALGKMKKCYSTNSDTTLSAGEDSLWVMGRIQPGTEYQNGKLVKVNTCYELPERPFRYNEFVVPNEAQVKIRYLVQVKI